MTSDGHILELVDVSKRYESVADDDAPQVLERINLQVAPGESLAITGPSGSGKSTLLNIMAALDRPGSGRVLLDGVDLVSLTDKQLAAVRNRQVGLVFQAHHLLPQCTALENVLVPTMVVPDAELRQAAADRAIDLLQRVGLAEHMHRQPGRLSIGQCQRVAFVRALINRPKLLLADEPTGSLDRTTADELAAVLVELNARENVTLIVVTHSLPLASRLDRHLELRDGRLLCAEDQS